MSFDLAKRHLKADITRRAIIDSSISSSFEKKSKTTKPKAGAKLAQTGAAKPSLKEYNPYTAAIDNSSCGKIKSFKKQLQLAQDALDGTSSLILDIVDQKVLTSTQAKASRRLSAKAFTNLELLTRKKAVPTKTDQKAKKFAARVRLHGKSEHERKKRKANRK